MSSANRAKEVDDYVEALDEPLKSIVVQLRETILSMDSGIKEAIKWNVPTYSGKKMFCSIMAHKAHVNLQLFNGAQLPSEDVLGGTGKNMRHIKYTACADIKVTVLKKILKEALTLDRDD